MDSIEIINNSEYPSLKYKYDSNDILTLEFEDENNYFEKLYVIQESKKLEVIDLLTKIKKIDNIIIEDKKYNIFEVNIDESKAIKLLMKEVFSIGDKQAFVLFNEEILEFIQNGIVSVSEVSLNILNKNIPILPKKYNNMSVERLKNLLQLKTDKFDLLFQDLLNMIDESTEKRTMPEELIFFKLMCRLESLHPMEFGQIASIKTGDMRVNFNKGKGSWCDDYRELATELAWINPESNTRLIGSVKRKGLYKTCL